MALPAHHPIAGLDGPSPWVQRWSHLVPAQGPVLDVACGHGRHARWFAARGHPVTAVDRSADALASLGSLPGVQCVQADIEGTPWPLPLEGGIQEFAGVVVTNYLWRALFDTLRASVGPGGVLIYETFAQGNETVGKPSRPDFLLAPGELLHLCRGWRVIAYEDGYLAHPERFVQRIVAVRPTPPTLSTETSPARYQL